MTGSSPGTLGMEQHKQTNGGFSLVELMLALFISAVMAAAIFNFFAVQNKSYSVQDQVTEIQQNIRAAIDLMVKEIRMAGYDPTEKAGSGILTADSDRIAFTMDLNADANCNNYNEYISYSLYTSDGIKKLGRKGKQNEQNAPVAENAEALGFAYAFDSNGDGILDTDGPYIIWGVNKGGMWFDLDTSDDGKIDSFDHLTAGENTGISVKPDDIRAVRVWLLIRSSREDEGYTNKNTYVVGNQVIRPAQDADTQNDHLRMRLMETIIRLRNMSLQSG